MYFRNAIVRTPGKNFADGLTTSGLGAPVYEKALAQHRLYCEALRKCGLQLIILEPDLRYPDSTFIEDVAVLTQKSAILTNPGADSRKGEVEAIKGTLAACFDQVCSINPPGTMDGGDICEAGDHYFIGISERTNEDGARQLAALLAIEGYTSSFVDIHGVPGILHLKSGISYLGDNNLVLIDALAGWDAFAGYNIIQVDEAENYAANCVRINDVVIMPAGFPRLKQSVEQLGYPVLPLEVSEYQKMDGGLSCLSLRF
ncbi:MAG: N(G),N(G)-dimethylarginine dimethylaminohydrolase [Chloroflexota bacterium]|nr:MAG: N(G),N(G)-dimethylarginine dimethylaminohydrolase [Chloroflexota bacterium]